MLFLTVHFRIVRFQFLQNYVSKDLIDNPYFVSDGIGWDADSWFCGMGGIWRFRMGIGGTSMGLEVASSSPLLVQMGRETESDSEKRSTGSGVVIKGSVRSATPASRGFHWNGVPSEAGVIVGWFWHPECLDRRYGLNPFMAPTFWGGHVSFCFETSAFFVDLPYSSSGAKWLVWRVWIIRTRRGMACPVAGGTESRPIWALRGWSQEVLPFFSTRTDFGEREPHERACVDGHRCRPVPSVIGNDDPG